MESIRDFFSSLKRTQSLPDTLWASGFQTVAVKAQQPVCLGGMLMK
jgi:hypothetical protein